MNNAFFGKTMENVRKHRGIKLVTTENRRNNLVSEPNYHATKFFTESFLAIELRKTEVLMKKPVYLGLSIVQLNKILMYEFRYDYLKPKYGEKTKLCHMNTDSFIVYIKTDDIYKFNSSSAAVRTGLLWLDNTSTCFHVRFNSNSSHHQLQCVQQLMMTELELKRTWKHVLVLSSQRNPVRTAADDDLNIYKDIAEDVETRFDTSNNELNRPLPKAKNKRTTGLMKDELGGKNMTKFVGLKAKAYSYLIDNGSEDKKLCPKSKLKFKIYKQYLQATQLENKIYP